MRSLVFHDGLGEEGGGGSGSLGVKPGHLLVRVELALRMSSTTYLNEGKLV